MQQKRRRALPSILLLMLVLVLAGGGVLMVRDIPAPQQPVEKQLDAKAFLPAGQ